MMQLVIGLFIWLLVSIGNQVIGIFFRSIERVHQEKIDKLVKATPPLIKQVGEKATHTTSTLLAAIGLETFRILLILFYLPTSVLFRLFPRLYTLKYFVNLRAYHQILFSRYFRVIVSSTWQLLGFRFVLLLLFGLLQYVSVEKLIETRIPNYGKQMNDNSRTVPNKS